MLEISVKVSNDDQSYVKKYLEYTEALTLSKDDPKLSSFVQQAVNEFKGEPTDVIVRIKMVW